MQLTVSIPPLINVYDMMYSCIAASRHDVLGQVAPQSKHKRTHFGQPIQSPKYKSLISGLSLTPLSSSAHGVEGKGER